jgi:hypothetical protein
MRARTFAANASPSPRGVTLRERRHDTARQLATPTSAPSPRARASGLGRRRGEQVDGGGGGARRTAVTSTSSASLRCGGSPRRRRRRRRRGR